MGRLSGKTALVTAAAQGIGKASAELFAREGARVIATDINEALLAEVVGCETRRLDVMDPQAILDLAAELGPVDVLFNNAGVASTQAPQIVLAVNYLALRRLSEGLLGQIPSGGAIVNTASIAGGQWQSHLAEINQLLDIADWDESLEWVEANLPGIGSDSYSFSKEVIRVWGMRHSRTTIKAGVRTNSVCPAPIDTPLLADFKETMGAKVIDWNVSQTTGTIMTAREVAMPLAFLGSAAAAYVNGTDLVADGGFTAAMTTGQVDFSGLS